MGENEIKKLIQQEIAVVFAELKIDMGALKVAVQKIENCNAKQSAAMGRIERYLIGDEQLEDIGLAARAKFSYEYARRGTEGRIIERTEEAIKEIAWVTENKPTLMDALDKYKAIKALFIFSGVTGIVSIINLASILLDIFAKINK